MLLLLLLCYGCRSTQHTITEQHEVANDTIRVTVTDTLHIVTETTVVDTLYTDHEQYVDTRIEEYYDEQTGKLTKRITTQSEHIKDLNKQIHQYQHLVDSLRASFNDSISNIHHESNTFNDIEEQTSNDTHLSFADRLKRRLGQELALFGFAFLMFTAFRYWIKRKL